MKSETCPYCGHPKPHDKCPMPPNLEGLGFKPINKFPAKCVKIVERIEPDPNVFNKAEIKEIENFNAEQKK